MPSSEMMRNVSEPSIGDAKRLQGMCRLSIMIKKDDVLLTPKKCGARARACGPTLQTQWRSPRCCVAGATRTG